MVAFIKCLVSFELLGICILATRRYGLSPFLELIECPLPVSRMEPHHMLAQFLVPLKVRVVEHQEHKVKSGQNGVRNPDVFHDCA